MATVLWAIVMIGGPILIVASVIYGLLSHRSRQMTEERRRALGIRDLPDGPKK